MTTLKDKIRDVLNEHCNVSQPDFESALEDIMEVIREDLNRIIG